MSKTLPARADIEQLRRQAKELRSAASRGDADARARFAAVGKPPSLSAAQLVLAREHGFDSWNQLRSAVAAAATHGPQPSGPLFPAKHAATTRAFGPADFLAGARAAGWTPGPLPDAIVFTFHGAYAALLEGDERFERNWLLAPSNATMFMTRGEGRRVAVTCLSPGATAMVSQVENQHELGGAQELVILNAAGAISTEVPVGSVLVTTSAVRDDGISHHYLPPDVYVDADPDLSEQVLAAALAAGLPAVAGTTWTVPTPFRATREEIDHLAADGVDVTECETASLLAVAASLGLRATACLAVTSSIAGDAPQPTGGWVEPAALLAAVLTALGVS